MARNKGDWRDSLEFAPQGSHSDGTDISSAVAITIPNDATKILIQSRTKALSFTLDGTTPTSQKGFKLAADDPPLLIPLSNATSLKVIEEEATADMQYQFGTGG
jgi:hypothetical protein